MKRMDANFRVVSLLVLLLMSLFSGCQALKSQLQSGKSSKVVDLVSSPVVATPEQKKISISVADSAGSYTVEFNNSSVSLGEVLSARRGGSNSVGDEDVVVVKKGASRIFLPQFLAISSSANKIALEDGDSVQFTTLSLLPTNVAQVEQLKAASELLESWKAFAKSNPQANANAAVSDKEFPADVYELITGKKPPEDGATGKVEFVYRDNIKTRLSLASSIQSPNGEQQKGIAFLSNLLKEFDQKVGKDQLQVSVSGLLSTGNTTESLDVFSMVRDVYEGKLITVKNNVPANIAILSRGNNQFVFPVRRGFVTVTMPSNVYSASQTFWSKQFVQDGDKLLFTRLQIYAPVLDGIRKDVARQVESKMKTIAPQVQQAATKGILPNAKKQAKQFFPDEPGFLETSLKRIPMSLPNLSLPNLRLF